MALFLRWMEIVNLWWILMLKQVSTISPPLPVEQLGFTTQEPILTTGEALEKYNQVAQKVNFSIEAVHRRCPTFWA